MTFNSKEQQIIKWASENGKGRAETEQALVRFRTTGSPADTNKPVETVVEERPSFIEDVKQEAITRADKTSEIRARKDTGILKKGFQLFGQGAGFVASTFEKGISKIPGVTTVIETAGKGIEFLATSEYSPIKKLGDVISESKALQEATTLYDTDQDFRDTVDAAANTVRLGADIEGLVQGAAFTKAVTNKIITNAPKVISQLTPQAIKNLKPTEFLQKFRPSEVIENTQNYLSRKNVGENFEQSIKRLAPEEPLVKYNEFFEQEMRFKGDIKQDTAIGVVGGRIGNAYDKVIALRRSVGNKMGEEIKKVGDIKVSLEDAFPKLEQTLFDSGVIIKGKKAVLSNTSKITSQEKKIIEQYINELNKLGANPTAGQLDAFLSRMPTEIDIFKSKNNVTKITNGERIIKGNLAELRNSLSPTNNPLFADYFKARTDYASLSKFLDEGASFLGKKTQAGDFAKDASLAKSSVQSILNQGKKDWLLVLEDLTGYQALDESVLALQAMKDAGNFRGSSLLDLLTEGSKVPKSAKDIPTKILEFGAEQAGKKFAGSPTEQTVRTIESILSR